MKLTLLLTLAMFMFSACTSQVTELRPFTHKDINERKYSTQTQHRNSHRNAHRHATQKKYKKQKKYTQAKQQKKYTQAKRHTKQIKVNRNVSDSGSYRMFKKRTNLRKSFKVYKDKALLAQANGRNTRVTVDVRLQRVRLYVNNKVALDSPCTTGAKHKFEPNTRIYRDKHTPLGTFKIMEKIHDKRSTIFGKFYRGKRMVYKGDRRKYRGSRRGVRYVGASLKNWMRLTNTGIGLHASKYVKRYPGTNGCIRLPYHVSKTIFKNVRRGTRVSVVR